MSIKEQGGNLSFKTLNNKNVKFSKNGSEVATLVYDKGFYDRGSGEYDNLYSSNFGALNGKGTILEPNSSYPSGGELKLPYSKYTELSTEVQFLNPSSFDPSESLRISSDGQIGKYIIVGYGTYIIVLFNETTGELVNVSDFYSLPSGVGGYTGNGWGEIKDIGNKQFLITMRDDYGGTTLLMGTFSDATNTVTFGTSVSTPANSGWSYASVSALTPTLYVLTTTNSSYAGTAYIITSDGTNLTSISTGFVWTASNAYYVRLIELSATKFAIIWSNSGVSYTVGTYDDGTNTLSFSTISQLTDGSASFLYAKRIPSTTNILIYGRQEVTVVEVDIATDIVTNGSAVSPNVGPGQGSSPTPYSLDISPDATQFALTYKDSNYNWFVSKGTISGTTIEFDISEIVVSKFAYNSDTAFVMYPNDDYFIYYSEDASDSTKLGTINRGASASTSVLVSKPFAGIFDSSTYRLYTPGSIWTTTGLTPAATYYCQSDGTISLTPDSASIIAGKAISTTQMVVGE